MALQTVRMGKACQAWKPQRSESKGLLAITSAVALLVLMSFDLGDLPRHDPSMSHCQLEMQPVGLLTQHMPYRRLLTMTRSLSGAGQPWQEQDSPTLDYRMDALNGTALRTTPPLATTTKTATQMMLRPQTSTVMREAPPGALLPLIWRQTVWRMPRKPWCSCTGGSSMLWNCSPTVSWEARLEVCEGDWPVKTGKASKIWRPASWRDLFAPSGVSSCFAVHMNDDRATGGHGRTRPRWPNCLRATAVGRPAAPAHPPPPRPLLKPQPPQSQSKQTTPKTYQESNCSRWPAYCLSPTARHAPQCIATGALAEARPLTRQAPPSRAGPKSGSYLRLTIASSWLPGRGLHHGPSVMLTWRNAREPPPQRLLAVHNKRAYRRARLRASQIRDTPGTEGVGTLKPPYKQ